MVSQVGKMKSKNKGKIKMDWQEKRETDINIYDSGVMSQHLYNGDSPTPNPPSAH